MTKQIIPYNSKLKSFAKKLKEDSTLSERLLWGYLRNKRLKGYHWYRQKMIQNYIVDFYCKELMLIIEIDGITHIDKFVYDQKRQFDLESLGIKILRFNDLDIKKDIKKVLWVIQNWIDEFEGKNKYL